MYMQKWFSYPLTLVFFLCCANILLLFHPVLWLCFYIGGYEAHKRTVTVVSWLLLRCTHILGTRYRFENAYKLPTDRPLLFVANHQSFYDIPVMLWFFRRHHPKFVSKIELGRGIPSVSFTLRHGGSVLIDRKNPKQSIAALEELAAYIEKYTRSAVIFPEGTRSRTGVPRRFRTSGIKTLMKRAPSALIVPVTLNNSWKLFRFGVFPMGLGVCFTVKVHQPLENTGDTEALIRHIETQITQSVIPPH